MYELFDMAKLQQLGSGISRTFASDWQAFRSALASLPMISNAFTPPSLVATNFRGSGAVRAAVAAPSAAWPAGMAPHGFVFDIVVSWKERPDGFILCNKEGQTLKVNGGLARPGQKKTPGPWFCAALIADPPGSNGPKAIHAYLHPLMDSDSLLLVDSGKERATLALLITACKNMLRGKKIANWRIDKPIIDDPGPVRGIHPDFRLTVDNRRAVVETMGYSHSEYEVRKQRTQQLMTVS